MLHGNAPPSRARRIVHVSADFPDPVVPDKTPVIKRLVDLVGNEFEQQAVSINRVNPSPTSLRHLSFWDRSPAKPKTVRAFDQGIVLEYEAPPHGILHATRLDKLGRWLGAHFEREICPDLLIGHKLSVEGIIIHTAAKAIGKPYALTIQGNSDLRILDHRKDLWGRFREIFHGAACVFSFAPWALREVEVRLGKRIGMTLDLPCPVTLDVVSPPSIGGDALVSVFHLRNHRIKNLSNLVRAQRKLERDGCSAPLRVYGAGSDRDWKHCAKIAHGAKNISLMGPRSQDDLGSILRGAIAMVMPSWRESFGLVFIEALFAGLPIIYPRGAAVDGYFDSMPFAIAVDAGDVGDIARAMHTAVSREAELKRELGLWQASGGLLPFGRDSIRATFAAGLRHASESPRCPAAPDQPAENSGSQ